jgi:GGDEF domain-containing protein
MYARPSLTATEAVSARLDEEIARATFAARPVSVAVARLAVRPVAPTHGERAAVEAILSRRLASLVEPFHVVARLDADRFVAILAEYDAFAAESFAGRVIDRLEAATFVAGEDRQWRTFGQLATVEVATATLSGSHRGAADLLAAAEPDPASRAQREPALDGSAEPVGRRRGVRPLRAFGTLAASISLVVR